MAFFVLLLAELIASSFADMAALRPADGAGYSDEKTPLLLDSTALQDSFDVSMIILQEKKNHNIHSKTRNKQSKKNTRSIPKVTVQMYIF